MEENKRAGLVVNRRLVGWRQQGTHQSDETESWNLRVTQTRTIKARTDLPIICRPRLRAATGTADDTKDAATAKTPKQVATHQADEDSHKTDLAMPIYSEATHTTSQALRLRRTKATRAVWMPRTTLLTQRMLTMLVGTEQPGRGQMPRLDETVWYWMNKKPNLNGCSLLL